MLGIPDIRKYFCQQRNMLKRKYKKQRIKKRRLQTSRKCIQEQVLSSPSKSLARAEFKD
jgi:hypothetical protein